MRTDFHNTVHATGETLRDYTLHTQNQDEAVLAYFCKVGTPMTPRYVWRIGFPALELTSVRRAISNLTRDGRLVKTDVQLPGAKGRPEYLWRLPGGQLGLFS